MSETNSQAANGNPATPSCRRRFSDEFKRDAVALIVDHQYSFKAAAKAVGVSEKSLRDWHKILAPPPATCGEGESLYELRHENRRLKKQLRRAEMERDILKKATAYFAKESL